MAAHARNTDDTTLIAHALRWNELFSRWPAPYLNDLQKSARLERYRRRTQMLSHDRHRRELLLVVSGCVEISSVSPIGRKYVIGLLGPGQVAPMVRLLEDVPLAYDYHAHEDSVIVHLPSDAVISVLDAEPILWRDVAYLGLQRQRTSMAMLQALTLGSIRRRVAATLLTLLQTYGHEQRTGVDVRVRLTQHDLASMLGLSRQTINKELGALVDEGVLEIAYLRVSIKDREALRRISTEE
jgi:CRP-like cAMP-binding protein